MKVHGLNSESYLEKYMGQTSMCVCGNKKTFRGITLGFTVKCEECSRSESAIESKKRLKEDAEKFAAFRKKTADGMVRVWAGRDAKDISPYFTRKFVGDFSSADNKLDEMFVENLESFFDMES